MPVMLENAALRDGPNGKKIPGEVVLAGDGVAVLAAEKGWSQIKDSDGDEGWVSSTLIDMSAAGPLPAPIEKQKFANSCVVQALVSAVNPHYLLGVAQQRSALTAGTDGDRVRPYRFTAEEWKAVVPPLEADDINSINQQIAGFAIMTRKIMETLGPVATPVQLYQSQWPDAPNNIADELKTAFDDTADIEAKAEAAMLDPHVVDGSKATPTLTKLKTANEARWSAMKVNAALLTQIDVVAHRLVAAKAKYEGISVTTTVPWFIIAAIHEREKSNDINFTANIAQGDPWNKVSTHAPTGRGPFSSFEQAAVDALTNCAPFAAKWGDWSVGGALTLLEQYNGLGYALRGLPSPYIWASSDQYRKGKFTSDHHFDPNATDSQLGSAPLLNRMQFLDSSITF